MLCLCIHGHIIRVCMYTHMYKPVCVSGEECTPASPSRIKTCEPDARLRLSDLEAAETYPNPPGTYYIGY